MNYLTTTQRKHFAALTDSVENLSAGLHAGVMDVINTTDANNERFTVALLPIMFHNLATICTKMLLEIARHDRARLEQSGWSCEQIDLIEGNHRKLWRAVSTESQFKASLSECFVTSLMNSWRLC